jgi:ADP-ribose pyrophosphatase YjhB (NUDIX family)
MNPKFQGVAESVGRSKSANSYELRSSEFPRTPTASPPQIFESAIFEKTAPCTRRMSKIYGGEAVVNSKIYGGEAVADSKIYGGEAVVDSKIYGGEAVVNCRCGKTHQETPPGLQCNKFKEFQGFTESEGRSKSAIFGRDEVSYENSSLPKMSSKLSGVVRPNDTRHGGYCNNCGKYGHSFHQCKMPITSYGLIVFRSKISVENRINIEYLMIRRRDTLGFIDFMRGKYSVYNKEYILNMIVQMTDVEKTRLLTESFREIWTELWGNETMLSQYRVEEENSREKLMSLRNGIALKNDYYTLADLIKQTQTESWEFAEWGFPKGRRNYQEKDYECAVREFCEETGYDDSSLIPIQNILPFEEIFTGSNYKSYKHKYYLTYMPYADSLRECSVQSCEVSCAEWKTLDNCLGSIRHYNAEKRRILENVHRTILEYVFA